MCPIIWTAEAQLGDSKSMLYWICMLLHPEGRLSHTLCESRRLDYIRRAESLRQEIEDVERIEPTEWPNFWERFVYGKKTKMQKAREFQVRVEELRNEIRSAIRKYCDCSRI